MSGTRRLWTTIPQEDSMPRDTSATEQDHARRLHARGHIGYGPPSRTHLLGIEEQRFERPIDLNGEPLVGNRLAYSLQLCRERLLVDGLDLLPEPVGLRAEAEGHGESSW